MKNRIVENTSNGLQSTLNYQELVDYQYRIEPAKYYIGIHNEFPEVIVFYENIDSEILLNKILDKYSLDSDKIWKYKDYHKTKDKLILNAFLLEIERDIFVFCDSDDSEIRILYSPKSDEKVIKNLIKIIKKSIPEPKAQSKIFLLYENSDNRGLYLKDFKVKKFEISLEDNYNDDFQNIHKLIVNRLNKKEDKGLVLLHGEPGTGKTTYIRYLTSLIDKKMIYIAPEFAHRIASPSFLPFLIDNPNSILIIEDAENIIEARENSRNMSVSNLLNVADGLLSDCLNIQLICTFNTHISKVDKALLRKGRLIASYEFKALVVDKAQNLSDKIGFTSKINKAMNLAEIYNQNDLDFNTASKKETLGF